MKFPGLLNVSTPKTSPPPPSGGMGGGGGVKNVYWFFGQLMTFPGFCIFDPLKPPWGGVGQMFFRSNDSRINLHMHPKFGCSQTVVSKKRGVQTHTDTHKGTLQLYIVDNKVIHTVCMFSSRQTQNPHSFFVEILWQFHNKRNCNI